MKEGDQARTQADFSEAVLARSKGVMVELWLVLGVYRESMTLIGGWAPYFIVEKFGRKEDDFRHIGSIDIDVALDPEKIDSEAYESIAKLLSQRGYKPRADKLGDPIPFSFERDVLEDFPPIQIDFLGPEYGGSGKSHRFQKVQEDFKVRKARGADVVLTSRFTQSIETILPNGASEIAEIYIADAVGSITTKAMALGDRYKEKDAYDIFAVVAHGDESPRHVAQRFKPLLSNGVVQEAIEIIAERFRSESASGPFWVADFLGLEGVGRERIQAEAFAEVSRFLEEIQILGSQ
ncbi:MAG: hypothetical protein IIB22_03575 [Chloroflexi bacterium]|nr:hypothetical protein [Chloroflexota bacterium]